MSMLTNSEQQAIDKDFSTSRLIWLGMTLAIVAYVIVGLVYDRLVGPVQTDMEDLPGYVGSLVHYGGYVLAALFLAMGCWAGRSMRQSASLSAYKSKMLVALALCEAVALVGFVTMVFNGDDLKLYILAALALGGMIYVMPRKAEFTVIAEKSKQTI